MFDSSTTDRGEMVQGACSRSFAEIQPERINWLWEPRIPFGSLTVLAGDPGVGKSTLTAELAARASNGDLTRSGGAGAASRRRPHPASERENRFACTAARSSMGSLPMEKLNMVRPRRRELNQNGT